MGLVVVVAAVTVIYWVDMLFYCVIYIILMYCMLK